MTTPSSPPIGLKDVATELGVSSSGLSLGASNVRALAGIASGPIGLHSLLNKSSYTPMVATVTGGGSESQPTTSWSFGVSVSVTGGNGVTGYTWKLTGTSGTASISAGQGTASATVTLTGVGSGQTANTDVHCTVTDTGHSVDSNTVTCVLTNVT